MMDDSGCGCVILVIVLIVVVALFATSGDKPITQEDYDRMANNSEWYAGRVFPECVSLIEEVQLRWVDDVEAARDKMAKQNGIKMRRPAGVWDKDDKACGTALICDSGRFIFIDKKVAQSEGEVWDTYAHELRHIWHELHPDDIDSESEPFYTLHEEIRTSAEMVAGVEYFISNSSLKAELKDKDYRQECIKQLRVAEKHEKKLIKKYEEKLIAAKRKRAAVYNPRQWHFAPGVF